MKTKKRNALFGRYPSCDMLNNALRFIYESLGDPCDVRTWEKFEAWLYKEMTSDNESNL